jgi:surface antigen
MLAGCAQYQNSPKQGVGTLVGAAGGGLLGSQFGSGRGQLVGTAMGVLLGAWLGNEVGRSMDEVDRIRAQQAHVQALDTGQTIRWDNPNNGDHGAVQPLRSGTDTQTGAFCREFQSTVVVGGQQQQAYGTACRQPDGSWRITNN